MPLAGPARSVRVVRLAAIEEARSGLPIIGMEQEVMEAVAEHDVILLCGETGSGKTTQVRGLLSVFMSSAFGGTVHHRRAYFTPAAPSPYALYVPLTAPTLRSLLWRYLQPCNPQFLVEAGYGRARFPERAEACGCPS